MSKNILVTAVAVILLVLTWSVTIRAAIPVNLVSFKGGVITRDDLKQRLLMFVAVPNLLKQVSATFIRSTVFRMAAQKHGIVISNAQVEKRLKKWEQEAGGSEKLNLELQRTSTSWYKMRSAVKDLLLFEALAKKYMGSKEEKLKKKTLEKTWLKLAAEYDNPVFYGSLKTRVASIAGKDYGGNELADFLLGFATSSFIKQQLSDIIKEKLLLLALKEKKVELNALDLEHCLAVIREQLTEQSRAQLLKQPLTLEAVLANQGQTVNELRKSLSFRARAAKLKLLASKLNTAALESFYLQHREDYLIVRCYHIMAPFKPKNVFNLGEIRKQDKMRSRAVIAEVEKVLKQTPGYPQLKVSDFLNVLKRFSKNSGMIIGGDLGFIAKSPQLSGFLQPSAYSLDYLRRQGRKQSPIKFTSVALFEAGRKLTDAALSNVVESYFGCHILLRIEARYPKSWVAIRSILRNRVVAVEGDKLSKGLLASHKLQYHWQP